MGLRCHFVYLCSLLGVRGSPVLTQKGSPQLLPVTHFLIWVTSLPLGTTAGNRHTQPGFQVKDLHGPLIWEAELVSLSLSFSSWRVESFSALVVSLLAQLHMATARLAPWERSCYCDWNC